MFAKIKHIAIVTDDCQRLGAFYESVFKLRREASEEGRRFRSAHRAVVVTDGYVGLNFNFRKPGVPQTWITSGSKLRMWSGCSVDCGMTIPLSNTTAARFEGIRRYQHSRSRGERL